MEPVRKVWKDGRWQLPQNKHVAPPRIGRGFGTIPKLKKVKPKVAPKKPVKPKAKKTTRRKPTTSTARRTTPKKRLPGKKKGFLGRLFG